MLASRVLTLPTFAASLDPKLDFFAGTVAGVCIPEERTFLHPEELTVGHVCTRLAQEWQP